VAEIVRAEDNSREGLLTDWRLATQVLDRAGFECAAACPGFGAALSFDDAGKSVLLTTDASTPEDYVVPVASWIASGTRTGKCILTKCDSCGTCTYVAPNGSATPSRVLCFICAQKAKLAAMGIFRRVIDRYPLLRTLFRYACLFIVVFLLASFLIPESWEHSWKGLTAFTVLFIGVYYFLFAGVRWLQTGPFKTPTSNAQSS
jgi:ferredoxin